MHTLEQLRAGELIGSRRLKLACGLTHFPPEILNLAETLEILDLSGNALSELPDDLTKLRKLRIIFCSDNQFTALPEILGRCPALSMIGFKANRIRTVSATALPTTLRWLILTDNQIETLPDAIGRCTQLQKLMLAGNRLKALPETLMQCQRLELMRIAANQLTELPTWLLSLPRLSWLAFSGNSFGAALESKLLNAMVVDEIAWRTLTIEQLLGEGASGFIHRGAYMSGDDTATAVAVKLFKGTVTSDGLPQSEMAAAIVAGQHPNLIKVFGKVNDHPDGVSGLVMELIDSAFTNLAQPPNLDSCTRDIYPLETRFYLPVLLRILQGIASAAQHLHRVGIMHGDLYGHNILQCELGRALIGDFGAASFYVQEDQVIAEGLQRLEVRAFGCLLEELLERCHASTDDQSVLNDLNELKLQCLSDDNARRPLFDEIAEKLITAAGRIV